MWFPLTNLWKYTLELFIVHEFFQYLPSLLILGMFSSCSFVPPWKIIVIRARTAMFKFSCWKLPVIPEHPYAKHNFSYNCGSVLRFKYKYLMIIWHLFFHLPQNTSIGSLSVLCKCCSFHLQMGKFLDNLVKRICFMSQEHIASYLHTKLHSM